MIGSRLTSFVLVTPVLLGVAVGSCDRGDSAPSGIHRWDSAGVTIVESHSPLWGAEDRWGVNPEPALSIGAESDDLRYEFTEVVAARLLGDTMIVVADLMLAEVRFFSRDGELQGVLGRRGDGPGEFDRLQGNALGVAEADTVWVFDVGLNRITLTTGPGDPVRVVMAQPRQPVRMVGRLADGSWLLMRLSGGADPNRRLGPGIHPDMGLLVRHDQNGILMDTLAAVPVRDIAYVAEAGAVRRRGVPLFGRRFTAVTGGPGYYAGDMARFEIGGYLPDGTLRMLIRVPGIDLSIDDKLLSAAVERLTRGRPEPQRRRAALLEGPRRATAPAYQELLVDAEGNLWVSTLDPLARGRFTRGPDWYVFGPDGAWLGVVAMPDHFEPMDIGEDWVLGIYTDDLGVQHVRTHGLERGR